MMVVLNGGVAKCADGGELANSGVFRPWRTSLSLLRCCVFGHEKKVRR
jgi:hypothetical protein